MRADFLIADYGSIALLTPLSPCGMAWRNEFLPSDAMTWNGGAVIEPRYLEQIVEGIVRDGLTVRT